MASLLMSTLVGQGKYTMPAFLQARLATEWVLMVATLISNWPRTIGGECTIGHTR